MSIERGLVQVYTGNGKGKTTAALGLAMRAVGSGLRVCIIQFMKSTPSGELKTAEKLGNDIEMIQAGRRCVLDKRPDSYEDACAKCLKCMVDPRNPKEEDFAAAARGLAIAREKMTSNTCDLLILDELNCAVDFKLVTIEDVLALLSARPDEMELVITGRNARPEITERADLVTEMKEIKHPWQTGISARRGIEY